ncbi:hypothetical protein K9L67_01750 [Candidatus Woesearchaeota archaeon]|nr:hypothetical protein [Candidatus Woesearchaeota archaeon]MCF7900928.1 hypothetical protein [Candidatus Woesearchaeota archaeon]MCF8012874.1 hypothetical protein [Candidatus Woesearchaeota archaeon]
MPSNLKTDSYPIKITTYYDDNKRSDSKTEYLDVKCKASSETEDDFYYTSNYQTNTNTNQKDDSNIKIEQLATQENYYVEESSSEETIYIIVLAIIGLLLFFGIIGITIYLVTKN